MSDDQERAAQEKVTFDGMEREGAPDDFIAQVMAELEAESDGEDDAGDS